MRFLAFGGLPGHAAQSKKQECLLFDHSRETHAQRVWKVACGVSAILNPIYAAVKEDQSIERYGLNAVCTHLGCVVCFLLSPSKVSYHTISDAIA